MSDGDTKGRSARGGGRVRTFALGAAGVALLAAVIFGVSALSGPRDATGPNLPQTTLPASDSGDLYADAMDALASGETTRVVELLERALIADPSNAQARAELDRITRDPALAAEPGGPGNATGEPSAPPDESPAVTNPDAGFTSPVADVGVLLPESVPGYELALAVVVGPDASVAADPVEGGPVGTVRRALFTVHDRATPDAADAFLRDVTRIAYPNDSANVTVDGVSAYFGTDGTRFAVVAYKRGRFVFEVVVTTAGQSPAALRDATVSAARAFPDALR